MNGNEKALDLEVGARQLVRSLKTQIYTKGETDNLLNGKVDKVTGKGLSTNDYTTTEKNKLANIEAEANKTIVDTALSSTSENPVQNKAINTALGNKVDKVSGKGLSTNDYTTAEKNKLAGIDAGADVNVIEAITVNGAAKAITNKTVDVTVPTKTSDLTNDNNTVTDASYTHTDNNYTTAEKEKLAGIESNANHTTVATALSSTETNPVQGKVIHSELGKKANLASPTLTGTPKAPTAAAGTSTTQIATTAFVTTAVANAVSGIQQFKREVVDELPALANADLSTLYLVPHSHGTNDTKDEYIVALDASNNRSWEKIGNTDIDLSGYVKFTDIVFATAAEVSAMIAEEFATA